MKALCFDGTLAVRDVPDPEPREGEALVRVLRAGVCNTDLEIVRGYMGHRGVLGHELLGVVEEGPAQLRGRRVAGEINLACRSCPTCTAGLPRHCPNRTVMGIAGKDGCIAEWVTLPVASLRPIPDGVPDAAAAFVEPLAAAFEVLEQLYGVEPPSSDRIAVLGDGKLGLLCAMALRAAEPDELVLVGRHERKRALATRVGIETAEPGELVAGSFDVVVEATGSPSGLRDAIALLRPRGRLVLKSTFHGAVEMETAPLVIHELTVIGSRCGPFEPALDALEDGSIDPTPLVDAVYPLDRALDAFEHAARRDALKIVIAP